MTQTYFLAVAVFVSVVVLALVLNDLRLSQPPEDSEEESVDEDTVPLSIGRWTR